VPCSSCHIAITRRNEMGDAFRLAGLHWPGSEAKANDNTVDMKMGGWLPSFLPKVPPIALIATASGAYDFDAQDRTTGSPTLMLALGAALSPKISVFGTWDGGGPPNELYLMYARVAGSPVNVRIGQFEQHTTMFKLNEALMAKFATGTFAANGFAISESRVGAEASAILGKRVFVAAGTVGANHPDVYYHARYKLGGADLRGAEPDVDLDAERGLQYKNASLWTGVMAARDQDLVAHRPSRSVAAFAELSYAVKPWLIPMYQYQYEDSATQLAPRRTHDVGAIFMLLENLRVRAKVSLPQDDPSKAVGEIQILCAF
jgi:hypothetical protein